MHLISHRIIGRKIRFSVVGCGRISKNHFEAIKAHSADAELVSVCDVDTAALERAAQSLGVRGFRDLGELLAETQPDVVVLATPSGLHSHQAIEVAKSGRHVLTEKPMATRWQDGLKMVEACDNAKVHLFVVKQNRLNPTLQLVRKAIDQKRFGRIFIVSVNVFWSRPQEYYDSARWRGTWEFDGGALMNQASHYIDLMDWLIGPVESVQSSIATLARDIEVEDTAVMQVKWRSGALGSANVTMLTYKQNFEGSITIIGEKGTVRVGGQALNEIKHWEFADVRDEDKKIQEVNYQIQSVYGKGHTPYYGNVIRSLRGEEAPLTDGREGLRSLELLIASYLSARDGRKVSLPLEY
jgi:UDP-N-acetyl-2-amino-2-deoxyglucuronate dehydrogenase